MYMSLKLVISIVIALSLHGKHRRNSESLWFPDISFGWGYATVSLRTKKIKGLHENDFIMAGRIDRLFHREVGS